MTLALLREMWTQAKADGYTELDRGSGSTRAENGGQKKGNEQHRVGIGAKVFFLSLNNYCLRGCSSSVTRSNGVVVGDQHSDGAGGESNPTRPLVLADFILQHGSPISPFLSFQRHSSKGTRYDAVG